MSGAPRIVTSRFIAWPVDAITRRASLVVDVRDEFRNGPPREQLRVALKELPRIVPPTNGSGQYLFFDVPDGDYTLVVEPDPARGDVFFLRPAGTESWSTGFARRVALPKTDPLTPVEQVVLTPKASYPFPAGATLLLGKVMRLTDPGPPVPLATITSTYERARKTEPDLTETVSVSTATDANGYFVLFFHSFRTPEQAIAVTATDGTASTTDMVSITEGRTTLAAFVLP